ncbi:MAG: biopolymer transporter ExbD [Planctomycetes bacterium]|nr:biopolymer transporter ExbD [Planctomycetota bacterium]
MRNKKHRKTEENATPDLTPMIDVTFQLLIFFILCTRFKVDERNMQIELPLTEGIDQRESSPKTQITIYCVWDGQKNYYQLAIDSRGRRVVNDSHNNLNEVLIRSTDNYSSAATKRSRYRESVKLLGNSIDRYINDSGANIDKIEIAYSNDNTIGTASGTAPWMFVSLAIDAVAHVNKDRAEDGKLPVTFKFSDALQQYQAHDN